MTIVVTRQRAQEVHDRARARNRLPYAYGGAFTEDPRRSTDCSGLVLQTGAWWIGRTDWPGNRYGSTESFRLDHKIVYDLGFRRMPPGGPAALPFKPVMLVGLQHGGGGVYSHTACTLMTMDRPGGPVKMSDRGVDWESRGGNPGVFLYDGARAWNDPLFHDFWYLDARLEDTGSDAADILARATGLTLQRAGEILPTMSDGLKQADCTSPNRIAMFIAQTGHESDNFNATQEYDHGRNHGDSNEVSDRWKYKGRTWIQVTWREHYLRFGQWCHARGLVDDPMVFVNDPRSLADLRWAGLGAAWYWTEERPMNALVDAGEQARWGDYRGFAAVTAAINGGTNGIADRRNRYARALALGDDLLALLDPDTGTPAAPLDPIEELLMSNQPRPSLSHYRRDNKPVLTPIDALYQTNAMRHEEMVEAAALRGEAWAIRDLAYLAGGEAPGAKDADGPFWVARANHLLAVINAVNPQAITAATPRKA